jgi:protein ImuA
MPTRLLSRPGPTLRLTPEINLALARVHEACGPARRTFALWLAGQMRGPVLWIAPDWQAEALNPDGMAEFADPGRFIFVAPRRAPDLLWCTEEALRAGAAPLVVADLPGAPGLTPVRRMQLAAETGAQTGAQTGTAPLGLLLTPDSEGTRGVETRWHMAPAHEGTTRRWRLQRRRARIGPPRDWTVTRTDPQTGPQTSTAMILHDP